MVHNGRQLQLSIICILAVHVFRTLVYGKNDVLVKSCPTDKSSWDTAARRKECELVAGTDYVYHCLKNKGNQLVEACLLPSWIESGICPVLFESGDFGGENCIPKHGQVCPTDNIRSNRLYLYPICFDTSTPEGNNSIHVSKGVDEGNSSLVNEHNRIKGLKHLPVVTALSGALLSGMSFWLLYLYYKRKYIQRKEVDMECGIGEEKERLYKNQEYSYSRPSIVQLTAYTEGLRILEQRGILIITGRIGSGKTTAVDHICKALVGKGKEWKVKTRFDSDDDNEKWIIVLDDCFGKFVSNPTYTKGTLDKLNKLFSLITQNIHNKKAVITMSENEFSYFSADFSEENEQIKECRLCLDKLNTKEKDKILKSIFKDPRLETSMHGEMKMKLQEIDTGSVAFAALGWPLICRLVSIPEVASKMEYFSKNPLQCMVHIFENLQSDNEQLYCVMIYALFKGGDVSRLRSQDGETSVRFLREISKMFASSMLPPESGNQDSVNNIKSLDKTEELDFVCHKLSGIFIHSPHYFLRTGLEMFQFHHKIFELGLLSHFYKQNPTLTIEYLDFDVITEIFRPKEWECPFYEIDVFHLCSFDDNRYETVNSEETTNPKAGQLENVKEKVIPSWKFVLEESMISSVITKFRKGQREKDFKDHPLMRDNAFKTQLNGNIRTK